MKKSFILHKDSLCVLDKMPDDVAGKFIKAIYQYQLTGELPQMDFAVEMAVTPFINQFIRDNGEYERISKERSEAAKLRWSEINSMQLHANASTSMQTDASVTDSDSDSDSDSEKESVKVKGRFIAPTTEEVKEYCTSRGNQVDPVKFINHYQANGWMVGRNKMKDWMAAVRTWEGNNFTPVTKPTYQPPTPPQTREDYV